MASKCISECLNIEDNAIWVRPGTTFAKIHKWPAAEAEFIQSISHGGSQRRTTAVESISCRQVYLRSYTFSRKEEQHEDGDNLRRCFGGGGGGWKKVAKKCTRRSKIRSRRSFVVRFLRKYLLCSSPNK
ncbi:hypothetical protein CARUB_v10018553mg [Capsella rubella]|uniref:Uncharacterized protein n=1 Tax=Capsella rubella TaxID=81985 RepID=R0H7G0_9BRAS|nr:uncharacterized protein LOC17884954 [Capsella rubella]EOA25239.1 hypothetical protein CARUB_v10018553mg [Capsella rubella]